MSHENLCMACDGTWKLCGLHLARSAQQAIQSHDTIGHHGTPLDTMGHHWTPTSVLWTSCVRVVFGHLCPSCCGSCRCFSCVGRGRVLGFCRRRWKERNWVGVYCRRRGRNMPDMSIECWRNYQTLHFEQILSRHQQTLVREWQL